MSIRQPWRRKTHTRWQSSVNCLKCQTKTKLLSVSFFLSFFPVLWRHLAAAVTLDDLPPSLSLTRPSPGPPSGSSGSAAGFLGSLPVPGPGPSPLAASESHPGAATRTNTAGLVREQWEAWFIRLCRGDGGYVRCPTCTSKKPWLCVKSACWHLKIAESLYCSRLLSRGLLS